jgi:hypothetical protein
MTGFVLGTSALSASNVDCTENSDIEKEKKDQKKKKKNKGDLREA